MHIVMTSSAKMPNSVKAPYRNVAVVKLNQHYTAHGLRPKMISERAVGVLAVRHLGRFPANGKTLRSGYQVALARAEQIAFEANNAKDWATAEQLMTTGSA
jgi:hypothetical protein